jgi:cytochrome c peroxidase
LILLLSLLLVAVVAGDTVVLKPPLGLDLHLPVPESNPLTREKIALGRKLFFDPRLSRDGTLACATCHDPERAFSDGRAVALGLNASEGARNTPALINRGYGRVFLWDGRAPSLERQVLQPIVSPRELGLDVAELERRTGMTTAAVTAALASYVRTIRSGDSRFDRYAAGQRDALTPLERTGLEIFRGRGGCASCHAGPSFTDEQFHNTGVAWRDGRIADEGRFVVSRNVRDRGAFKTPTLREIARTAPYMHDGSLATLEAVIDFYSDGGRRNPHLDPEIRPRDFTAEEKRALAAFLRALTGRVLEGS